MSKSNLDDLMKAYSDLSGNNARGSGFKGPAVKDIKREAPKQVFQHSNKARDWRAFDQNLEDVFGAPSSSSSNTSQPNNLSLAPSHSGMISPHQYKQQQQKQHQYQQHQYQHQQTEDDWGDFSSAFSSQHQTVQSPQQSIGSRLASLQDESPVHRFKNNQFTQQHQPTSLQMNSSFSVNAGLSNLTLQPQPIRDQNIKNLQPIAAQGIAQSKSQPNSILDLDDDEFGDFASPSTAVPLSTTTGSGSSKTFSTTFPIDQPLQIMTSKNTFPVDEPIKMSNTFNIDQPISAKVGTFSIDQPITASPAPMSLTSSNDKYSALRDLLGDDGDDKQTNSLPLFQSTTTAATTSNQQQSDNTKAEEDDFGDFAEFETPQQPSALFSSPPIPQQQQPPVFPFLGNIYKSNPTPSNMPVLNPSSSINKVNESPSSNLSILSFQSETLKPVTKPVFNNQDDDYDEWSLPPSNADASVPEVPQFRYQPPSLPPPFLCSSPPPETPPRLSSSVSQDREEEFSLPSEQFGFSDQEIFGVKKPRSSSTKPQSLQDVIGQSVGKKSVTTPVTTVEDTGIASESSDLQTPTPVLSVKSPPECPLPSLEPAVVTNDKTDPKHVDSELDEWSLPPATTTSASAELVPEPASADKPDTDPVDEWSIPTTTAVADTDDVDEWGLPPPSVDKTEADLKHNDEWSLPATTVEDNDDVDEWGLPPPASEPMKSDDKDNIDEWSVPAPTDEWSLQSSTLTNVPETNNVTTALSEWSLVLSEISKLFETVSNTYSGLNSDLITELTTHQQGKEYLEHLAKVYTVFTRIVRSYQVKRTVPGTDLTNNIDTCIANIEKQWKRLEDVCGDHVVLTKLMTDDRMPGAGGVCGVCLGGGADLESGGGVYHPACANYWVNCVRDTLPTLT